MTRLTDEPAVKLPTGQMGGVSSILMQKGRYTVRFATGLGDIAAAQDLRSLCFATQGPDQDDFDSRCHHILVEHSETGKLVCCFRLLMIETGEDIAHSYAAQYYDLDAMRDFSGRMIELGRFCIHPEASDPDILRVAWGALTGLVDAENVQFLFGCSSFEGTDAEKYLDAFAVLKQRHLAPRRWLPRVKAPKVFRYAASLTRKPDVKIAMLRMPPLLKTYLLMGGRVSDHAVVDDHLNTLHVFTGVEINAIPAARKRLLRAVAM